MVILANQENSRSLLALIRFPIVLRRCLLDDQGHIWATFSIRGLDAEHQLLRQFAFRTGGTNFAYVSD